MFALRIGIGWSSPKNRTDVPVNDPRWPNIPGPCGTSYAHASPRTSSGGIATSRPSRKEGGLPGSGLRLRFSGGLACRIDAWVENPPCEHRVRLLFRGGLRPREASCVEEVDSRPLLCIREAPLGMTILRGNDSIESVSPRVHPCLRISILASRFRRPGAA
jgi:hypothetical protein